MATGVYRDPSAFGTITFSAGSSQSSQFSCIALPDSNGQPRGCAQLRRLDFPSNWTAADITFTVYSDNTFTNPLNLSFFDLTNKSIVLIPLVLPNDSISLAAPGFDSVVYFVLNSSVLQVNNVSINVILDPLYNVGA